MAEPATVEIPAAGGEWKPTTLGLLGRHVGRRVRVTIDHPGMYGGRSARGQVIQGELLGVGPSEVSTVYGSFSVRGDAGGEEGASLPWGHPFEVLVDPLPPVHELDDEAAAALVLEAVRRYDTDPRFHARARLAARLAERTEYSDLEGAVLVGAVLALVVDDHPELIP